MKISIFFLTEKNPKIYLVLQKTQNDENNPKEQKQNKVIKNKIKIWRHHYTEWKVYYKVILAKTVWHI